MKEYIFAFMYKPNPRAMIKLGSVWAPDHKTAKTLAGSALKDAYPDHVKDRLFRASDTRDNRSMLPIPDPDSDGWLTPAQARAKESNRASRLAS